MTFPDHYPLVLFLNILMSHGKVFVCDFVQRNGTLSRDSWWIYYCYYCYLVVDSGYGLNHEALRVIGDHLDWRVERREQEDEKKERVIRIAARATPTTTIVRTRDELMWLCKWSWRKAKLLHQLQSMSGMREKSQVTTVRQLIISSSQELYSPWICWSWELTEGLVLTELMAAAVFVPSSDVRLKKLCCKA